LLATLRKTRARCQNRRSSQRASRVAEHDQIHKKIFTGEFDLECALHSTRTWQLRHGHEE